jgi:hypothetical protein
MSILGPRKEGLPIGPKLAANARTGTRGAQSRDTRCATGTGVSGRESGWQRAWAYEGHRRIDSGVLMSFDPGDVRDHALDKQQCQDNPAAGFGRHGSEDCANNSQGDPSHKHTGLRKQKATLRNRSGDYQPNKRAFNGARTQADNSD